MGASEHWSTLEEKGLLNILGHSHMEEYSKLITSLFPLNKAGASLHGPTKKASGENCDWRGDDWTACRRISHLHAI